MVQGNANYHKESDKAGSSDTTPSAARAPKASPRFRAKTALDMFKADEDQKADINAAAEEKLANPKGKARGEKMREFNETAKELYDRLSEEEKKEWEDKARQHNAEAKREDLSEEGRREEHTSACPDLRRMEQCRKPPTARPPSQLYTPLAQLKAYEENICHPGHWHNERARPQTRTRHKA